MICYNDYYNKLCTTEKYNTCGSQNLQAGLKKDTENSDSGLLIQLFLVYLIILDQENVRSG